MTPRARLVIRSADAERDAESRAQICGRFVRESVATFEYEPPTLDEMAARVAASCEWLVAEVDGEVIGFASAGRWNPRPAYDWTCETTIYLRPDAAGAGVGTQLYRSLTETLRDRGFPLAIGRIALPNDASVRLHERLGYEPVGVHRALGFQARTVGRRDAHRAAPTTTGGRPRSDHATVSPRHGPSGPPLS